MNSKRANDLKRAHALSEFNSLSIHSTSVMMCNSIKIFSFQATPFLSKMSISALFSCDLCAETSFTHGDIVEHIISMHLSESATEVFCDGCETRFPDETTIIKHFIDLHTKFVFFCDLCSHMSNTSRDALEHAFSHIQHVWTD